MNTVIPAQQLLQAMLSIPQSIPGHPANVLSPTAFRSGLPPGVSVSDYNQAQYINQPLYARLEMEQYRRMLGDVTHSSADIAQQLGVSRREVDKARRSVTEAIAWGELDPSVGMVGGALSRTPAMHQIMGGDVNVMTRRLYRGLRERTHDQMIGRLRGETLPAYRRRLVEAAGDVGSFVGDAVYGEIYQHGLTPDHRVLQGFKPEDIMDMAWGVADSIGGFSTYVSHATGEGGIRAVTGDMLDMQGALRSELLQGLEKKVDFMAALGDMLGSRNMQELQQALKDFGAIDIDPANIPDLQHMLRKADATAAYFNISKDLSSSIQRTTATSLRAALGVTDDQRGAGLHGGGVAGYDVTLDIMTRGLATARALGITSDEGKAEMVANENELYGRIAGSTVGKAARMITSAFESGLISGADFDEFSSAMRSGNLGQRDRVIDRLLTQRYGSVAEARRRMDDSDYMAYVDQGVEYMGLELRDILLAGDRRELNLRNIQQQRAQTARRARAHTDILGLTMERDTEAQIRTDAILDSLTEQGATMEVDALKSQVDALRAAGVSEEQIRHTVEGRLRGDKAFEEYSETALQAATTAVGRADMSRLRTHGGDAAAVMAALDSMYQLTGVLEDGEYGTIRELLKTDPAGALQRIEAIMADEGRWLGDPQGANRKLIQRSMDRQRKQTQAGVLTLDANDAATRALQRAWNEGVGATRTTEDLAAIVKGMYDVDAAGASKDPRDRAKTYDRFIASLGEMGWLTEQERREIVDALEGGPEEYRKVLNRYRRLHGLSQAATGDVKRSTGSTHTSIKAAEQAKAGDELIKDLDLKNKLEVEAERLQKEHTSAGDAPDNKDPRATLWQRVLANAPEWAGKAAGFATSLWGKSNDIVTDVAVPGKRLAKDLLRGRDEQKIVGELRIIDSDGKAHKATLRGTSK